MRRVLGAVVVVMLSAVAANASTITAELVVTSFNTTTGVATIDIRASSNAGTAAGAAVDGGISGFQFDIVSDETGLITPVQAATIGGNATKVKTTFAVQSSDFATQLLPTRRNVVPADNAQGSTGTAWYIDDADLDAPLGSFADTNGSQTNTILGNSGFATIATETWTLANPALGAHLHLFLVGPQYYDFTNGTAPSFTRNYTSVAYSGTSFATPASAALNTATTGQDVLIGSLVSVPEPTSLVLMGFGVVGLMVASRRRTQKKVL